MEWRCRCMKPSIAGHCTAQTGCFACLFGCSLLARPFRLGSQRVGSPCSVVSLVKLGERWVVSEEALAGTEIPECGGKRETTLGTRLSPPEWLQHWGGQRWEPFTCFINCDGQSHNTVSADHNCWRERRAEAESNRDPSAYQPKGVTNALPFGQTGSRSIICKQQHCFMSLPCGVLPIHTARAESSGQ